MHARMRVCICVCACICMLEFVSEVVVSDNNNCALSLRFATAAAGGLYEVAAAGFETDAAGGAKSKSQE